MHELGVSHLAGVVVPEALEYTLDFAIRQVLAVLAQKAAEVGQVDLAEVDLVDQFEGLVRVIVLAQAQFLVGLHDFEAVCQFSCEQVEELAVRPGFEGSEVRACGQACAQILVSLRENVVLEVVELDAPFAVLVDDALQQLSLFDGDGLVVLRELVLQFNLGDVPLSVFVEAVESFFDREFEVRR